MFLITRKGKIMINTISILGLWNERNYRIKINNNRLIIVGENGSGKTTILRIIYYVLTCNWSMLSREDFSKIEVECEGKRLTLDIDEIKDGAEDLLDTREISNRLLPHHIYKILMERFGQYVYLNQVIEVCEEYNVPKSIIMRIEQYANREAKECPSKLAQAEEWINKNSLCQVLYFPTYRRSEKYATNLREYTHYNYRSFESDYEVVREGMRDVDEAINNRINEIKRIYDGVASELNVNCFKGILSKDYEGEINIPQEYKEPDRIETVFSRLSNNAELESSLIQIKDDLFKLLEKEKDYDVYDQIVLYFYHELIEGVKKIEEAEMSLEKFFYVCNRYLNNKRIKYLPNYFAYKVIIERGEQSDEREIDLEHLSSGEKQLVSMLGYVYLVSKKESFVIIDEPELSLSVDWQQRILEDINESGRCCGLIAATQSPFVYDNSLRQYARELGTFLYME